MAAKYLNIDNDKYFKSFTRLQKFLPLERALQMLETKKLWFSNPAKWPDPFERRFVDGVYDGKKKFTWQGRVYCMCVTPIATSEASWKAYSEKDIAVKLEFDKNEFLRIIDEFTDKPGVMDVFFGKMDYQQTKHIERPLNKIEFTDGVKLPINSKLFKARLLLLKRLAFKYECEYRAIVVKKEKSLADGILIDIPDIKALVKKITIGPSVGDEEYEMIKYYLIEKYKFDTKQIERSNLYKASNNPRIKNT